MNPQAHGLHFDDSASSVSGGSGFDLNTWRSAFMSVNKFLGNRMYSYKQKGMTFFSDYVSIVIDKSSLVGCVWTYILSHGLSLDGRDTGSQKEKVRWL
jgi:hypothetical protein